MTSPSVPSSPPSLGDPLTADGQCNPPNPSDWQPPLYDICVVHWCQGIVIFPNGAVDESRIQIKVRPRIFNLTDQPLDITIWKSAAVKLLVASSDLPGSWRPPPATAALGDDPILVDAPDGQRYYAIAPDIPGDVDLPDDPTKPINIGFASKWSASSVPPRSFWPPAEQGRDEYGQIDQDGDLVFQLPARTSSNSARLGGLALMDRTDPTKVLAYAEFGPEKWGPKLKPTEF